jgi:hypothetical protein
MKKPLAEFFPAVNEVVFVPEASQRRAFGQ